MASTEGCSQLYHLHTPSTHIIKCTSLWSTNHFTQQISKPTPLLSHIKWKLLRRSHLETRAYRQTTDERRGRDVKTTEQRWPDLKLELPLVTHMSEYSDQAASAVKRTPPHQ
jgi:hypothetical protein